MKINLGIGPNEFSGNYFQVSINRKFTAKKYFYSPVKRSIKVPAKRKQGVENFLQVGALFGGEGKSRTCVF